MMPRTLHHLAWWAFAVALVVGSPALAQQAPAEFEVASVKPNTSGTRNSGTTTSKGQVRFDNASLKSCIQQAFDVRDFSLSGPGWLDDERFDIVAKIPADAPRSAIATMLQALLKDRFKLVVHWVPKELSGYALVAARNGVTLHQVEDTGSVSTSTGDRIITSTQISMDRLADVLGRQLNQPVQNLTELKGVFEIKLEWTPDAVPAAPSGDASPAKLPDSAAGPSIFTALQQQLGLRLRAQKVTIQTLVVDHIERVPSEN
jgi:uncharacterized protein (TIGR03435 family)